MFNFYNTSCGVNKLILIDVYLSNYSPNSKVVIDAITKLHKKISKKIHENRIVSQES